MLFYSPRQRYVVVFSPTSWRRHHTVTVLFNLRITHSLHSRPAVQHPSEMPNSQQSSPNTITLYFINTEIGINDYVSDTSGSPKLGSTLSTAGASLRIIDEKNMFYVFYKSLKNMFFMFFYFFYVFLYFFNFVFLLSLKQNVQNNKYNAFLMVKDSISWTQRVFCSSIID